MDWDTYFMQVARTVSIKSKDPSKRVGAVIVGPDHEIRSTGWNGFARGVFDDPKRYEDRDRKYLFVVHAEMNAICNAARCGVPLNGCSLYVWPIPPCNECAKAIIQVGIRCVVFPKYDSLSSKKWGTLWGVSRVMFEEAGVMWREIDEKIILASWSA